MLDMFRERIKPEMHPASQNLLLRNVDSLDAASVASLIQWLDRYGENCSVSATAKSNLQQLANQSTDWRHLAMRLGQVEVPIAGLAQRREDIPILVHQLVASTAAAEKRLPPKISADCLELLITYNWPHNLLELSQTMTSALLMSRTGEAILPTHLPLALRTFPGASGKSKSQPAAIELDKVLLDCEREVIRRALAASPRNRAQAARLLGISRPRLLRRIEQLGLDSPAAR